jgi:glycerophosphoryl diester phosphodiesterase
MWVNIEIKNDPTEPDFDPQDKLATLVVDFLRTRGAPDQWLISSFRRETVDAVHRLWPELPTAWLDMGVADKDADALAKDLLNSGHQAYHPYVKTLTRSVVDAMHRNGVAVNTWTCDDPLRMAELVSWGIDGICTNVPDVALGVIANAK